MAPDGSSQAQSAANPEITVTNDNDGATLPTVPCTISFSPTAKPDPLVIDVRFDSEIPRPDFCCYEPGLTPSSISTPCNNSPIVLSPLLSGGLNSISWSPNITSKSPINLSFENGDGDKSTEFSFRQ